MIKSLILFMFSTPIVGGIAGVAAQEYPVKPLRFIVGPGPDVLARLVGQKLTDGWGQQVIVDQRPGAGGIVAAESVARAPADGYTLLLSTGTYTTLVGLHPKLPYDFVRDLAPVTMLASIPFLLVAHPSLPANNVQELLKLARAKPGQLNYSSSGNGTTAHLAGEMLKNLAKVNIVHIPYKGTVPAVVDLVAGQVHLSIAIMQSAVAYVKSGKLKALGVSSPKRSGALPDLPTIAEAGVPGYEATSWNGVHVAAGVPRGVTSKLHAELLKIVSFPDVRERMGNLGMEPVGNTSEQFAQAVSADIARWTKVIRDSNVRVD